MSAPARATSSAAAWIHVLTGEIGVLVGDETAEAGPGAWALKPRGILHTMWNSAATPARIIEVLNPGDEEGFRASCHRHGIEFFPDSPWLQQLRERYGL